MKTRQVPLLLHSRRDDDPQLGGNGRTTGAYVVKWRRETEAQQDATPEPECRPYPIWGHSSDFIPFASSLRMQPSQLRVSARSRRWAWKFMSPHSNAERKAALKTALWSHKTNDYLETRGCFHVGHDIPYE
jgi:hypothetical protein